MERFSIYTKLFTDSALCQIMGATQNNDKEPNNCKNKLAILNSKLKNARNYYLHSITKKITDEYNIITCEKLTVEKMLKEQNFFKAKN